MNRTIIRDTNDPNVKQYTTLDSRFYYIEDKEIYLPAVTWILGAYPKGYGLIKWMMEKGEEAERLRDKAATKGTKIHNAVADLLRGKKVTKDDKYWNEITEEEEKLTFDEWRYINWFTDWYKAVKPDQIIAIETIVYSLKHGYAGTIDLICIIDKKVWLIDLKTGNSIYPTHALQIKAYKEAVQERNTLKIDKLGLLHLGARNQLHYKLHEMKDEEKAFKTFLAVKSTFEYESHPTEPKIESYPDTLKIEIPKEPKPVVKKKEQPKK